MCFREQKGSVLLIALFVTIILAVMGAGLIFLSTTEGQISTNERTAQETLYIADAAIERVMLDLGQAPDWGALLGGATLSSFVDGPADRITPDGVTIVLATQTARVQANSDLTYGAANPNRPIWQLYGHSPIGNLLPAGEITTRGYAIIWLADDDGEADNDPLSDSNQIVALRAHAFGERGTETEIEVTVAMGTNTAPPPAGKAKKAQKAKKKGGGGGAPAPMALRVLSWRELR